MKAPQNTEMSTKNTICICLHAVISGAIIKHGHHLHVDFALDLSWLDLVLVLVLVQCGNCATDFTERIAEPQNEPMNSEPEPQSS